MTKRGKTTRRLGPLAGRFLTITEACERLGRTRATIRRLIRSKKLVAALVGSEVKVSETSVQEYMRPRPYKPQRGTPVCAGWNDKLREQLRRGQAGEATP
jgi:excisionase family DNA binding protein